MSNPAKRRPVDSITEGSVWRALLKFFFPLLMATFFQQLYNTVDAVVVGKVVGKEALAAVGGTTGTLINLLVGFFVGLSSGATVILSQFWGARDQNGIRKTVHTAAAMALTGGLLLMVFGYWLSPQMLRLINTPAEILQDATSYIRIYFIGMIPSLIYNIGSGLLRAVGDSRRPLTFLVTSCMTNIVLDILFVIGLDMGVAGAAIATILSQTVSAVLVIVTLMRTHLPYRLRVREIRFDTGLLRRILRIGFPAGLQSTMFSISNLIIQASINGYGTDVVAAWTAYGKIDTLYWMVINSFGMAITTFAGQNFGAGKIDRMKKGVRACLLMETAATFVISTLILLVGSKMLRLFAADPQVLEYGGMIIRRLVPFYICYLFVEIYGGALRGCGNAFVPAILTLFGICILRLIWVLLIAPAHQDFLFTVLCYPITWAFTSLLFVIYYHKSGWMNKTARVTS